ncbi:hypothetical protein UVI_02028250 [Ustilaginoidea virens]|uniref:GCS light chain n=1 Tax=Ustilaginoidea virens TaxID=1159556 RepID=A0A1B5KW25_USTVR|nr:hypothetical protein UVI_02028250 [Ustilaginoidea virens]
MSSGPSIIPRSGSGNRSNLELVNSLRDSFSQAKRDYAAAAAAAAAAAPPTPAQTNGSAASASANGTAAAADGPASRGGAFTPPTPPDVWTETDGDVVYVPRINWRAAGLRDEPSQYEITVKLFFLPGSSAAQREQHIHEALALTSRELGTPAVDLLVASFPGVSFEGTCEWEADKKNARQGHLDEELATWRVLEKLHGRGVAKRLGVAEFGSEKLSAFIRRAAVPPAVDQINLHDCCNVPPPLKQLAERHGIELNVHRDCTDILPPGTLRELLGGGVRGANVLADADNGGVGLRGNLVPQWVVRYMAFVRDRGVIENKGYFAGAELIEA